MAKLSELLGGILKDLTQGRILADLLTREYFDLYQKDPVMAQLPVPRVAMKEVTLRLRFAIEELTSKPAATTEEAFFSSLWRTELAERVVPEVLKSVLKEEATPEQLAEFAGIAMRAAARERFGLTEEEKGRPVRALAASLKCIMAGLEQLPSAARARIPATRAFRTGVERRIREQLEAFVPKMREFAATRKSAQMELEVLVHRADLAKVPEAAIQEVTLTVAMDDLRVGAAPLAADSEKK